MENVADALQIAGFVLIFVLALSISINAFGQARQTSQIILDYKDREYDYTYIDEATQTERIVTAETIVPSIYKAYKENYKIVFEFKTESLKSAGLYKKGEVEASATPICSIDLEKEVLGSNERKELFIEGILYGETKLKAKLEKQGLKIKDKINSDIRLNPNGLYDTIKGRTFQESLGVYYQEELDGTSNTPEANRTKKRVITYTEQ